MDLPLHGRGARADRPIGELEPWGVGEGVSGEDIGVVVAVEVDDRPGGLARVLAVLHAATINVEYMYAFVEKSRENAVLIFRFDDPDMAITILQNAGIRILTGEEVRSI